MKTKKSSWLKRILPWENLYLETDLTPYEIKKAIYDHLDPPDGRLGLFRKRKEFQGVITRKGFEVSRNRGSNAGWSPIIKGYIRNTTKGNIVFLEFSPNPVISAAVLFYFLIYLCMITAFISQGIRQGNPLPPILFAVLFTLFIAAFYLIPQKVMAKSDQQFLFDLLEANGKGSWTRSEK